MPNDIDTDALPSLPRVVISTELDADALRVVALLETLGYEVERAIPAHLYDAASANERAIVRVTRKFHLRSRERELLNAIYSGARGRAAHASALGVSVATAKWLLNALLTKLICATEDGVVAFVDEHRDLVLESPLDELAEQTPCASFGVRL